MEEELKRCTSCGRPMPRPLPPDIKAAIDRAAADRSPVGMTDSGNPVFINYGESEAEWAEMAAADDEMARLDADAARYRWLRDHNAQIISPNAYGYQVRWVSGLDLMHGPAKDTYDSAVDAAMAARK